MKRNGLLILAVMMLILASCGTKQPQPPVAQKIPYVISNNGNDRVDEYFWMRLTDEQKNAETPELTDRTGSQLPERRE